MKKLNLKKIAREIRANAFCPKAKWEFEEIEHLETIDDTAYGRITKYLVTIRFNDAKYDNNGRKFQVNHYEDDDAYVVFFDGSTYLV